MESPVEIFLTNVTALFLTKEVNCGKNVRTGPYFIMHTPFVFQGAILLTMDCLWETLAWFSGVKLKVSFFLFFVKTMWS